MSHDFWIERPDPDNGIDVLALTPWRNHTRNTSRMWHWSVDQASGGAVQMIQDTDGWAVRDAWPLFAKTLESMSANREKLSEWNPENKWGSYDSALEFLREITEDCHVSRDIPTAVVRWSV